MHFCFFVFLNTHTHIQRVQAQSSHPVHVRLEEQPVRQKAGMGARVYGKERMVQWYAQTCAGESVFNLPHLHYYPPSGNAAWLFSPDKDT